jgi:hypothetical protein
MMITLNIKAKQQLEHNRSCLTGSAVQTMAGGQNEYNI